jgi:hypothetical protein
VIKHWTTKNHTDLDKLLYEQVKELLSELKNFKRFIAAANPELLRQFKGSRQQQ